MTKDISKQCWKCSFYKHTHAYAHTYTHHYHHHPVCVHTYIHTHIYTSFNCINITMYKGTVQFHNFNLLSLNKARAKSQKSLRILFLAIKNRSLERIPTSKGLCEFYCNIMVTWSLPLFFLYLSYCRKKRLKPHLVSLRHICRVL